MVLEIKQSFVTFIARIHVIITHGKTASFTAGEAASLSAFHSVMLEMDTKLPIYPQHISIHIIFSWKQNAQMQILQQEILSVEDSTTTESQYTQARL